MIMKDRKESMHTYYFIIMLSTYWAFFHTSPNKKACERKGLEKELLKKLVILPPLFFVIKSIWALRIYCI